MYPNNLSFVLFAWPAPVLTTLNETLGWLRSDSAVCIKQNTLYYIRARTERCKMRQLTPWTPAVPNCCSSKGSVPYWSNPPFLIFEIRALWRSVLSARAPDRQKLTSSSAMAERPRELDQRFQMGGANLRLLWIEELLFAPLRHDEIYAYVSYIW